MGIFRNLINKVNKGAARVGYAFGVVDCLDSGQKVGVFAGSNNFKDKNRWPILAEMHEQFHETEIAQQELVSLPRDSLDTYEVSYGKIAYQPALDQINRAKIILDARKTKSFASYLEQTLQEFESGSWKNGEFYSIDRDGFVKSSVSESGIIKTLDYYARKLGSVSNDKKHFDLIKRVSEITKCEYAKVK